MEMIFYMMMRVLNCVPTMHFYSLSKLKSVCSNKGLTIHEVD